LARVKSGKSLCIEVKAGAVFNERKTVPALLYYPLPNYEKDCSLLWQFNAILLIRLVI